MATKIYPRTQQKHSYFVIDLNNVNYDYATADTDMTLIPVHVLCLSAKRISIFRKELPRYSTRGLLRFLQQSTFVTDMSLCLWLRITTNLLSSKIHALSRDRNHDLFAIFATAGRFARAPLYLKEGFDSSVTAFVSPKKTKNQSTTGLMHLRLYLLCQIQLDHFQA